MITLYGTPQTRSFRALWALEEAKIDYNYHIVTIGSSSDNGTQTDSYKTLNFQGKVPCLVDDGFVVNESAAILNYIGQLKPEALLLPQNVQDRAYYDELCFFVLSDLEQPLWAITKHQRLIPDELKIADIRKVSDWEFARSIQALQNYIGNKEFAVADTFTMADILIAHTLRWAAAYQFSVPNKLKKYMLNLFNRPAYKSAMQKDQPSSL